MKRLGKSHRIPRITHCGGSEPTDADYDDKRLAKLAKDYWQCPEEWRECYLAGISTTDWNAMKAKGFIK